MHARATTIMAVRGDGGFALFFAECQRNRTDRQAGVGSHIESETREIARLRLDRKDARILSGLGCDE